MVSYGPWIQADDYEATGQLEGAEATVPHIKAYHSIDTGAFFKDPPATSALFVHHQAVANDPTGLVTDYTPDMSNDTGWPNRGGGMLAAYNYTGGVSPPWETHILALHDFDPRGASRYTFGVANWAPLLLGVPSGAIGWQWQDDLTTDVGKMSTAVGCEVTFSLVGGGWDNSVDPRDDPQRIGPFKQDWWISGATFTSDEDTYPDPFFQDRIVDWVPFKEALLVSAEDGLEDTDLTADLTPYLDELGRVSFFHCMDYETYGPVVPVDLLKDERGVESGYSFANSLAWTFRPPVFRWIYEDPDIQAPMVESFDQDPGLTGPTTSVPATRTRLVD